MILAGREVTAIFTFDQWPVARCPPWAWPVITALSSQDLSSVFPNSASRHAPRERLLSPHSAHARAPLTQTRAPLYSKCSPLFRQVVWPWLESPDVSISRVRNKTQTREIEILIIICFCEENKNLVKLLSGLNTVFIWSEIRQGNLRFYDCWGSRYFTKKCFAISCSWLPAPALQCQQHWDSEHEARKGRGAEAALSRLNP